MIPVRDLNPTRTTPLLNYALIALNLGAFFVLWRLSAVLNPQQLRALQLELAVVPAELVDRPFDEWPTIFSAMFMHWGPDHLTGNLLFLYIFGDNIEDALGRWRYLLFYFVAGLVATLAHVAVDPSSQVPLQGASGAIAGVLGAYLVLYPRARVLIFNLAWPTWLVLGIFFYAPAWLVLGVWFLVMNLLPGIGSLLVEKEGGVAFFAHLGGFIAGLVLVRPLCGGQPPQQPDVWDGWKPPPQSPSTAGRENAGRLRRR